jgi:hypothetical protein
VYILFAHDDCERNWHEEERIVEEPEKAMN